MKTREIISTVGLVIAVIGLIGAFGALLIGAKSMAAIFIPLFIAIIGLAMGTFAIMDPGDFAEFSLKPHERKRLKRLLTSAAVMIVVISIFNPGFGALALGSFLITGRAWVMIIKRPEHVPQQA